MISIIISKIDETTFQIHPQWEWNDRKGNIIKCRGIRDCFNREVANHVLATNSLEKKVIHMFHPILYEDDTLFCEVRVIGENWEK